MATKDTDFRNRVIILTPVKMGNVQLVNRMIQNNKCQIDANGNNASHVAVEEEFLRIADILVTHDPLVNVPDKVYSAMLNSLKQVTQDNKDLETESAILHELVEKLKYDLANTKEDADTEKINLSPLTSHLANFNEKYLKSGL
ncbi:hypothetical protein V9T40_006947 [Parthenolecanium corni]|uniref:Uncharacterized protein n=1 Tax=Parthenolecanium corni TaxID=536013 RepID=A0AAN9YB71_9HEMI